ncbi:MAG: T9SS type A sorting domain-containing protein [Bacteroidetes bacterium]|nr:T9SS type A sorting domain-containing protein [Bacteroidota bacterium]
MSSRLKSIAAFLLLSLICFTADAAHIIGGYMSYQCLGGENYRFTMILYRDCYGGGSAFDSDGASGAPFSATVTFFTGSSTVPLSSIELNTPTIDMVQPLPDCFSQSVSCVERGIYVFEATLPAGNEPIHVVYQRCCRNATISNIAEPGATGATWTITITPEARAVCNTSPVFGLVPMLCAVVNEPYSYDHAATDADGDELTYEFCAPLLGGGTDQINPTISTGVAPDPDMPPPYDMVNYLNPPSTVVQPIPGAPAYVIDPNTGVVNGTPNVQGRYLYAVCVNEFRNGQLLSVTRYEFEHDAGFLTGIDEIASGNRLKIFPNPTNGVFNVEMPKSSNVKNFEVKLYDMNGRKVANQSEADGSNLKVTIPELLPGVYQLVLCNGQEIYHEKIVVKPSNR